MLFLKLVCNYELVFCLFLIRLVWLSHREAAPSYFMMFAGAKLNINYEKLPSPLLKFVKYSENTKRVGNIVIPRAIVVEIFFTQNRTKAVLRAAIDSSLCSE